MADDAGALLVRSGLVTASALDDARARMTSLGGTLGEQLVTGGAISDDDLTDFYRARLLVPQVNPNALARLTPKVVSAIPGDMAIELRSIPVSLDADNNLTIAMSDPSDRHAVDEIAFFTGAYVVRAVATQMQIAWCLAHYYGHVTALGQRLLSATTPDRDVSIKAAVVAAAARIPRTKGLTGKVNATRHRAIAPVTGPVNVLRPTSGELDLRPLTAEPPVAPAEVEPISPPRPMPSSTPQTLTGTAPLASAAAPPAPAVSDGAPERPRARSVSGEIRVPVRRAPSIRPPLPAPTHDDDDDDGDDEPMIMIEGATSDDAGPRTIPIARRRAIQKSDPPELYARSGEVDLRFDADRTIDADEPRIVIDQAALAPVPTAAPDAPTIPPGAPTIPAGPTTVPDGAPMIVRDDDSAAVIHDRLIDRESAPILLDRPRATPERLQPPPSARRAGSDDVVMLKAPKPKPRPEWHTQVGVPPAPVIARQHRDTETGVPAMAERDPAREFDEDTTAERLAAPESLASDDDTSPHVLAPPPAPQPAMPPASQPNRRWVDFDLVDDGWGPPGTTIPPPLLGAIPGSEDDEAPSAIPMPNVDSQPLTVGPPTVPPSDTGGALVRTLEEAAARAIDVIRQLERASSRDEVVDIMVGHLAETHHRAGFFVTRPTTPKGGTELGLFSMLPRPPVAPLATLRLDRPSTLQDVVGTRLPYRGPMHDDASRTFLIAVLGACPAEILLVPVAVRERVVGVLFGEHRQRHTFDDQLALAARAAGMALERILKAKRG